MRTIVIEKSKRPMIANPTRHPREIAYHRVMSMARSDSESKEDHSHFYCPDMSESHTDQCELKLDNPNKA
jgi:hypothetical protein